MLALFVCGMALQATAREEEAPVALEAVRVNGVSDDARSELTHILLDSTRPQSWVTRQTIEDIASPFSDFGTLANLTPSFASSAPNGNGFDAAKNMTLRGFPDGQFNVTLDGIPFADPDGFSHHSTSFFPASSIERIVVDRSPGGGTSLGYATIGGSLNIASLAIPSDAEALVYGAYGSFATSQTGVRLNTARPKVDGDMGLMANIQHLQTNGAMTNADGHRDDALLKAESRFNDMRLTLLYSFDDYHFKNPASVSTAQIDQFGPDFGFTAAPGVPTYAGYAKTDRQADFGYARLQASLGAGVNLIETLYTYSYSNQGLSLKGDLTSSPVGNGFGIPATDIGGRLSDNRYRTVGNILQLERNDASGVLRGGLWLEHSRQTSTRNALDLTTGAPYNANTSAGSPVLFDYDSRLDTVQPFVEYEWHASDALKVLSGLRYQRVRRGFEASVVPNSLPGTNGDVGRRVNSLLPSVEGNYAFVPETHAYVQWSKGALVPNQSFFYTSDPSQGNQAKPQTAQALQGGVIHAAGPLQLTVDAYWIDLKDYISTLNIGGDTQYINNGKVRYRGLEAEGNIDLGAGFTAVANASLIRAQFRTSGVTSATQQAGDTIPFAPSYTALVGLLYARGAWNASLLTKFVGVEYQGKNGSSDAASFRVNPYNYTNLTLSRALDDVTALHHAALSLQVSNVQDRNPVTDAAGPSLAGPPLVNVLARRSYLLTFRCNL
jgi:iron complex outermembrane receptor protein